MNLMTIIILALAVALVTFPTYTTSGVILMNEKSGSKLRFIAIMVSVQALMLGLGIVLGMNVGRISEASNKLMALSILMIFGLKVLLDSLRVRPQEKAFDTSDLKVLMLLSLAESIVPMAVAIAVGLMTVSFLTPWLSFIVMQGIAIVGGFFTGGKMGAASFKLRTGPIGGLFLIAASLQMIISMISY